MGGFNYFRYVIAVLLAIGLFILANIEEQLLIGLELAASHISNGANYSLLSPMAQGFLYTTFLSLLLFANLILICDSKVMLAIGLGGLSVCHLLAPVTMLLNNVIFTIICILEGFFYGMIFPFFLTVMSFWTPMMENTTLISISLFGYYLGKALYGIIMSKLMLTNLDVPFYVFGALGLCWTVLWLILGKRKPSDDPKITQNELEYILSNGNERGITTLSKYIRKRIFYTKSTFSILAVILCNNFNIGIYSLMLTIIGWNKMLDDTILYSFLVAAFVIVTIAFVSDYFRQKCFITKIRKTVICTGSLCSAILIPFNVIYHLDNSTYSSVLYGSFVVVQTIIQTSYLVNLVDVMHHAAGYGLGILLGIARLIAVVIILILTDHGNAIFWVVIALNVVGCLVYAIGGSAKREIWATNTAAETTTDTSVALKDTSNGPPSEKPCHIYIVSN